MTAMGNQHKTINASFVPVAVAFPDVNASQ